MPGTSMWLRTSVVGVLALAMLAESAPLFGQAQPGYQAPRSRNGDGKPDLNGIWQVLNTANWDLASRPQQPGPMYQLGAMFFVPPGRGVVEGDAIPYRPEAAAKRKQRFENRIKAEAFNSDSGDPEMKCYMPGVPRATYMPYPFQILQGQREILFAYQFAKASRVVHMNKKVEPTVDSWMGTSNGRWEGDTLVIDVTGLNGDAWLDRAGNFASASAHIIERYTPSSPYHLEYEATIEDPDVFTRPWTIRMPLYRVIDPGAELLEVNCVELSEEVLYGKIRTQNITGK
jgi:hypothetical protein